MSKLTVSGLGGSGLTAASSQATTCAIPASLRPLAIAIFLVLASPPMLHGAYWPFPPWPFPFPGSDGVEVIPQSYQISGYYTESFDEHPPQNAFGSYSLSSSDGTPLAASTTSPDGSQSANGLVNQFLVINSAISGPVLQVPQPVAQASAQGVWDVRPVGDLLHLYLNINAFYGCCGSGLTIELTDMTTSATLLDVVNPKNYDDPEQYIGSPSYTFGVNPSDVYEFSIYAHGSDTEDSNAEYAEAFMDSAPTLALPDGGLTIGLLGMAMGGLAFMRRKLK